MFRYEATVYMGENPTPVVLRIGLVETARDVVNRLGEIIGASFPSVEGGLYVQLTIKRVEVWEIAADPNVRYRPSNDHKSMDGDGL